MKSSIKRLFAMCAAVTAITAVTAVSASAVTYEGASRQLSVNVSSDTTGNDVVTVSLMPEYDVSGETTILLYKGKDIIPEDADILYINQDNSDIAKATGGFLAANGVLPKDNLAEKDESGNDQVYTLRVADESGEYLYEAVFTLAEESGSDRLVGNVNDDAIINVFDILAVVNHNINKQHLHGDKLQAADPTDDGTVNVFDILDIVDYTLYKPTAKSGKSTVADKINIVVDKYPNEQ